MIDTPIPAASTAEADRRRRWWVAFLSVTALALVGVAILGGLSNRRPVTPTSSAGAGAVERAATGAGVPVASSAVLSATPGANVLAAPGVEPEAPPAEALTPEEALALPGAVPERGRGTFDYAPGRGRVLGEKGPLRRFRVAVERGSGEEAAAFAAEVEATLGDRRGWVGGGRLRLQRVSGAGSEPAHFTVFLATRETAAALCARDGTDIRLDGTPFTSCRVAGKAIINLDRWRMSAPPYVSYRVALAVYRQYVINHEVGHELGHSHEGCPRRGGPAPVMVQQTLSLRGCVPWAWPRHGNHWLSGPPVRG